jgi:hypothetical protein
MPVMGPTYDEGQVDQLYQRVRDLIHDAGILNTPLERLILPRSEELRTQRWANMREAVRQLVELESWESF